MKPILFNTEMVKAILDGKKYVTRRSIKYKYGNTHHKIKTDKYGTRLIEIHNDIEGETYGKNEDGSTWHRLLGYIEPKPQYKVGDILYVRETYAKIEDFINYGDMEIDVDLKYLFKCDDNGKEHAFIDVGVKKWHPSIHMQKEASRIFLKITDVRWEKLQDISCCQAEMEGVSSTVYWTPKEMDNKPFEEKWWDDYHFWTRYPQIAFSRLWDSTVSKSDITKYGWEANPWVWVIEFKPISKEEALQS